MGFQNYIPQSPNVGFTTLSLFISVPGATPEIIYNNSDLIINETVSVSTGILEVGNSGVDLFPYFQNLFLSDLQQEPGYIVTWDRDNSGIRYLRFTCTTLLGVASDQGFYNFNFQLTKFPYPV